MIFLARLSIQTLQWQQEEILMTLGWGREWECGFKKSLFNTSLTKQTMSMLLTRSKVIPMNDSHSSTLYLVMSGFYTHKWQKRVNEHSFQIPVELIPLTFWVVSEILDCCCKQSYKNNIPHLYTDLAWSMKHPNKVLVTSCVWAYSYVGRIRT